ncbi:MAG TPA: hypothetical protein VFC99_00950 [Acidimicrobiia bacterium]|nr:hypothetical protein [Acidimicrobiia bacterium]
MTDSYRRFAGLAAVATAVAGVVFTVTFAVAVREGERWALRASAITLLVGAITAIPVAVALAEQLGRREPQFAKVALVLAVVADAGAALHGAWDTAVLAHPVRHADVPSYTDPRGFATFALTAAALVVFGWLVVRGSEIPRFVGQLALLAAALLLVVYFGRLIVLNPKRPVIKWVAVVSGLVVSPAFYLAYARSLLGPRDGRGRAATAPTATRTDEAAVR